MSLRLKNIKTVAVVEHCHKSGHHIYILALKIHYFPLPEWSVSKAETVWPSDFVSNTKNMSHRSGITGTINNLAARIVRFLYMW